MKKITMVFSLVLMALLTGCKTYNGVLNKEVNSNESGVLYGVAGLGDSVTEVCSHIDGKDNRCSTPDDYVVVAVFSKFGFSSAAWGTIALVPKTFEGLNLIKSGRRIGDEDVLYLKARTIPNQLGEVLAIASKPNEGKCKWSGMPRAGGTVCPAHNYDYRRDYKGINF